MTVRMYADRKRWPLERIRVTLRHLRLHAKDCADCETTIGWVDHIDRDVELTGDLDDTQRQRLLHIATLPCSSDPDLGGPHRHILIVKTGIVTTTGGKRGPRCLLPTDRRACAWVAPLDLR